MRPDPAGYRVVYIVDRGGIKGAQVKAPQGETGFIERSALSTLVQPVVSGAKTLTGARNEPRWQPCKLDDLLECIQVVRSPNGDWQAIAANPMQMANIVGRAEETLGPKAKLRDTTA